MEKEQFVAVDTPTWWLLERDLDHRMEDLRRELGATFGWTEPTWYTERARLEELYEFIAGRGTQLFYELDQAIDDHGRQRWLGAVMDSKKPLESGPAPMASASPAGNGAAPTSEVAPRKSAFGPKSQPEQASEAPAATGAAPPARKSIFKAKSQPEPAAPEKADGGQAGPGEAVRGDQPLDQVDQQIQTVMAELSTDELDSIASELGLSPEEVEALVREPDFAALVAEEQTHAGSPA